MHRFWSISRVCWRRLWFSSRSSSNLKLFKRTEFWRHSMRQVEMNLISSIKFVLRIALGGTKSLIRCSTCRKSTRYWTSRTTCSTGNCLCIMSTRISSRICTESALLTSTPCLRLCLVRPRNLDRKGPKIRAQWQRLVKMLRWLMRQAPPPPTEPLSNRQLKGLLITVYNCWTVPSVRVTGGLVERGIWGGLREKKKTLFSEKSFKWETRFANEVRKE